MERSPSDPHGRLRRWVVLDVVGSEDLIEEREVTIVEDACEGFEGKIFIWRRE